MSSGRARGGRRQRLADRTCPAASPAGAGGGRGRARERARAGLGRARERGSGGAGRAGQGAAVASDHRARSGGAAERDPARRKGSDHDRDRLSGRVYVNTVTIMGECPSRRSPARQGRPPAPARRRPGEQRPRPSRRHHPPRPRLARVSIAAAGHDRDRFSGHVYVNTVTIMGECPSRRSPARLGSPPAPGRRPGEQRPRPSRRHHPPRPRLARVSIAAAGHDRDRFSGRVYVNTVTITEITPNAPPRRRRRVRGPAPAGLAWRVGWPGWRAGWPGSWFTARRPGPARPGPRRSGPRRLWATSAWATSAGATSDKAGSASAASAGDRPAEVTGRPEATGGRG